MNKQELVAAIAGNTGMTKADSTRALDAVFESIVDGLKNGEEIRLVGFGTFSVAHRAASEGRDPRSGKPIKIEASKRVKFKAGKGLKDTVNASKASAAKKSAPAKNTKVKG